MDVDSPSKETETLAVNAIQSITLTIPNFKQFRKFTLITNPYLGYLFPTTGDGGGDATSIKDHENDDELVELFNAICDCGSDIHQALIRHGVTIKLNKKVDPIKELISKPLVPAESWRIPFVDNLTVLALLYRIWLVCSTFHVAKFLGPILALFQSSGWGKSRSIQGIVDSKMCDVLYLCCRDLDSSGYPPRSTLYNSMFQKFYNLGEELRRANKHFEVKLFSPFVYAIATSYYRVMLSNKKDIERLRTVMLDDTTTESTLLIKEMQKLYYHYAQLPYNAALVELEVAFQEYSRLLEPSDFNAKLKQELASMTGDSYSKLLIGKWFKECQYSLRPVVLVFDEARALSKTNIMQGYSLYRIVRQILRETPRKVVKFVGILVDTTSTITDLAPQDKADPSFRLSDECFGSMKLMRPVYDMFTMDLLQNDYPDQENMIELKLLSFRELFSLGRPLWRAHMLGTRNLDTDVLSAVYLAKRKLLVGTNELNLDSRAMCIACLACRLSLSFSERSKLNETLVANYMAHCRYISQDYTWMQIYYVSEPILAEAAAELWYDAYPRQLFAMVRHLRMAVDDKQISIAPKGEDVGKLLLLIARDAATASSNQTHPFYATRVSVSTFLTALVGENIRGLSGLPLELLDGLVSFTHFVHLLTPPSSSMLKRLWCRGAAVQVPSDTAGIDLIIPVAIFRNGQYLLTFILIQIKNDSVTTSEKNWNERMQYEMSRESLFAEVDDPSDPNTPYICIYMQLGHESLLEPMLENKLKNNHPTNQYCLSLSGLNVSVYPCLLHNCKLNGDRGKVDEIVTELKMLLDSAEPLYAEEDENGADCLARIRELNQLVDQEADGTRATQSGTKRVHVIKEPKMTHL